MEKRRRRWRQEKGSWEEENRRKLGEGNKENEFMIKKGSKLFKSPRAGQGAEIAWSMESKNRFQPGWEWKILKTECRNWILFLTLHALHPVSFQHPKPWPTLHISNGSQLHLKLSISLLGKIIVHISKWSMFCLPIKEISLSGKHHSGISWWLRGKEYTWQCRRCRFDPWVRKISWRRKWQTTPVFLPEKSHGQRSLEGYSPPDVTRESDATEWLNNNKTPWPGCHKDAR